MGSISRSTFMALAGACRRRPDLRTGHASIRRDRPELSTLSAAGGFGAGTAAQIGRKRSAVRMATMAPP